MELAAAELEQTIVVKIAQILLHALAPVGRLAESPVVRQTLMFVIPIALLAVCPTAPAVELATAELEQTIVVNPASIVLLAAGLSTAWVHGAPNVNRRVAVL